MRFVLGHFLLLLVAVCATRTAVAQPQPPVWPNAFNTTEIKFNPRQATAEAVTRFWYDWDAAPGGWARFTFVPNWYNFNQTWGGDECHIFFRDWRIVFASPSLQACSVDHPGLNISSISPDWMKNAAFKGNTMYRGYWANHWQKDTGALGVIDYWETATEPETPTRRIPLGSTNQANDPGVSQYVDFQVGPQDASVFDLPSYCSNWTTGVVCPLQQQHKVMDALTAMWKSSQG